jgi:hypothetical protein
MTREEAMAVAVMLVEAYPRDIREGTLEAYAMHLADLDRAQAVQAVHRLIATHQWLPAIAEVRAEVATLALPHAPRVEDAWAEAVRLMAKIGSYGALGSAGSPYVNQALRLCGRWADICHEDVHWLRRRFVEIYGSVVAGTRETLAIEGRVPLWLDEHRPRLALVGGTQALESRRG